MTQRIANVQELTGLRDTVRAQNTQQNEKKEKERAAFPHQLNRIPLRKECQPCFQDDRQ